MFNTLYRLLDYYKKDLNVLDRLMINSICFQEKHSDALHDISALVSQCDRVFLDTGESIFVQASRDEIVDAGFGEEE